MSDTDTESSDETNIQTYKCHICQYKPNFTTLAHILQQIIDIGPYTSQRTVLRQMPV